MISLVKRIDYGKVKGLNKRFLSVKLEPIVDEKKNEQSQFIVGYKNGFLPRQVSRV